jgi:hypothetical protein
MPPEAAGVEASEKRVATEPAGPGGAGGEAPERPLLVRCLRRFGAFWWDFLVGDTPELFVGALGAIGVLALLVKAVSLNAVAVAAFPVLVALLLAASLARERRSKR